MLGLMSRFLRGTGDTPSIRAELKSVPFHMMEQSFGALARSQETILTRYFRMKVQSVDFCGRAFHNAPLIEGFYSLALLYPVILWLARWHAVGCDRDVLADEDVARAITLADYQHGFSPWSRRRVRLLAHRGDIVRLCCRYGR
jgi:lysine-N-methylase